MCTGSRGVSDKTNLTYDYSIHGWNFELGLSLVRGNGATSSPSPSPVNLALHGAANARRLCNTGILIGYQPAFLKRTAPTL